MLEIKDYEAFQNYWEFVWCLQTFLKKTHIVFHRCFRAQKKKKQRYVLHKHMCNVGEFKIASPISKVCEYGRPCPITYCKDSHNQNKLNNYSKNKLHL
jgi:hypothetical protein